MGSNITTQVHNLQTNLYTIRKVAGISEDELGKNIGLSRQTIHKLEKNKTNMTVTQYIALRIALDKYIEKHPENTYLPLVIELLVDNKDLSKKDYAHVQEAIASASSVVSSKQMYSVLKIIFSTLSIAIPLLLPLLTATTLTKTDWLDDIFKKK